MIRRDMRFLVAGLGEGGIDLAAERLHRERGHVLRLARPRDHHPAVIRVVRRGYRDDLPLGSLEPARFDGAGNRPARLVIHSLGRGR